MYPPPGLKKLLSGRDQDWDVGACTDGDTEFALAEILKEEEEEKEETNKTTQERIQGVPGAQGPPDHLKRGPSTKILQN